MVFDESDRGKRSAENREGVTSRCGSGRKPSNTIMLQYADFIERLPRCLLDRWRVVLLVRIVHTVRREVSERRATSATCVTCEPCPCLSCFSRLSRLSETSAIAAKTLTNNAGWLLRDRVNCDAGSRGLPLFNQFLCVRHFGWLHQ